MDVKVAHIVRFFAVDRVVRSAGDASELHNSRVPLLSLRLRIRMRPNDAVIPASDLEY